MPPTPTPVSSAEIVRQFGRWQDHAAKEPVLVTHHGRGRVMLISADHYKELLATHQSSDAPSRPSSTELIDQLMEHLDQGFVAFGPDLTITALNHAACAFLRTTRDAVVGHRLDERMPGVEESLGYASLSRAVSSGSISTFEMPSFAYEGRWLLFHTFPLDGGAACLFRDITDELDARARIDFKTATLAALAVHAGIGRAKLTVRGTLSEVDQEFAGFAGFTPEGLGRARLTDILTLPYRAEAAEAVEAVLEGGAARALDVDVLTRAGEERPVRIGLAPLRSPTGAYGAVAVMTDRA